MSFVSGLSSPITQAEVETAKGPMYVHLRSDRARQSISRLLERWQDISSTLDNLAGVAPHVLASRSVSACADVSTAVWLLGHLQERPPRRPSVWIGTVFSRVGVGKTNAFPHCGVTFENNFSRKKGVRGRLLLLGDSETNSSLETRHVAFRGHDWTARAASFSPSPKGNRLVTTTGGKVAFPGC